MSKQIAVVVATDQPAEALRAAVGLTLRGDRVSVVWRAPVPDDDGVRRALGTLEALGHATSAPESAVCQADAVEIWSAGPSPAPASGAGGLIPCGSDVLVVSRGAVDDTPAEDLVREVLAARVVVVWPEETLDLRGEICPFTFVKTKLRLERLPTGARLRVLVDHEPATRNIPRSAAEWGQKVLLVTASDTGWEITIEKGSR
jgi:tRNA 2-thiouridine synthesizing protein A